ncbi:hypothetical protein BG006_011296 [Podila minutissima]|uniref:Uncharacterized protein n=1 Tax=Podila minutissima TaxID=64525 RepID=A0A9P5VPI7_9FUNG|nr:hypothetical protein BG006_011296 [Podila minutissima]
MARNQTGVPGMSVAIFHKGKLIFAEGFGKRNKMDPFTPEALTATTVGELVAEDKMDWDKTPGNTCLPEFETTDPGDQLHMSVGAFKGGVLIHHHYDSFTTVLRYIPLKAAEMITFVTGTDEKVSGISYSSLGVVVKAEKRYCEGGKP